MREDPEIEFDILSKIENPREALLIGSGGCTALTLKNRLPETLFTLLEPNGSQVDLIKQKSEALTEDPKNYSEAFGIGTDNPSSLTGNGNFESLFRCLRNFIYEFVLPQTEWVRFFSHTQGQSEIYKKIVSSNYWSVAFDLFFSDSILMAMFGPAAIQHAPKGSYPGYFKRVLENGLQGKNSKDNYFLHHIFLGYYIESSLPAYLTEKTQGKSFQFIETLAENVPSYRGYDLISLSNIFDWMEKDQVAIVANRLSQEMKPGSYLVYRQLNNKTDFRKLFGPKIKFSDDFSSKLQAQDRSLFYQSVHVACKEEI